MYFPSNILDEQSRIWIYQSDRELLSEEKSVLSSELKIFIDQWTAHNKELKGSFEILLDRFLIIMIDETNTNATGCSIDKSMNFIKQMEIKLNVNFTNRQELAYKEGNEIKTISKSSFEDKLKSGQFNENTIVFNNLIEKKSELKSHWQVALKESWHKMMLN